jgi:hypothetical protein
MKKSTEECGSTFIDIESYQELEARNEQLQSLLSSADIFISNSCDMECLELFDEQKSCRHMDWQEQAKKLLGGGRNESSTQKV